MAQHFCPSLSLKTPRVRHSRECGNPLSGVSYAHGSSNPRFRPEQQPKYANVSELIPSRGRG